MQYYLATVEAFERPATIVPNIGGDNNAYLWLKSRNEWGPLFEEWLNTPVVLMDPGEYEDEPSSEDELIALNIFYIINFFSKIAP